MEGLGCQFRFAILCKMLTMSGMEDKKFGRYERQTMLPEIRTGGQERLRAARVLVVGTGGLGSPVSLYLAGAGIGHIGLVDDDEVSTTNLHRQVLYAEAEVGLPKVVLAARRLRALNSDVDVKPYACRLTPDNAAGMVQGYDIVVDACDNYPTRYLLNDICRAQGKPYVYGAIEGFCGQVSVSVVLRNRKAIGICIRTKRRRTGCLRLLKALWA